MIQAKSNTTGSQNNLTHGQKLMWLGQQLHPDVPLYNMMHTHTIHASVDTSAFERAFNFLVDASEIMRTVIALVDNEPQAIVLDEIENPLEWVDFSNRANPKAAVESWVEQQRAQPFEMDKCLFDSVLIKVKDDQFVWYFSQHHIVTDAWSSVLLYQTMSDLYQQALAGESLLKPELRPFSEQVKQEQEIVETDAYSKASQYWKNELQKPAENLQFYGNQVSNNSARTQRHTIVLNQAQMDQLASVGQERGIRSFSHDLTRANIFSALICNFALRLTQQSVIRLGMPFANRPTAEAKQTLGMLIEVLSNHIEIAPDETFRSLVKKVNARNLEALRHTQAGLSTAEHNRAYDILLNFITVSFPDFAELPTDSVWVHSGYGDSNHQVRFQVHDMGNTGHIQVDFDFSADVFSATEQKQAIEQFKRIMRACFADVDHPLHQLPLLSADEYQKRFVEFNDTDFEISLDDTVVHRLEMQADRHGDAIAIIDGELQLTYQQLKNAVNQLAQQLSSHDVGRGNLVPICIEHSAELLISILAILKVGAAYVPLDHNYPDERLNYILNDVAEYPLVLVSEEQAERFNAKSLQVKLADFDLSFDSHVAIQTSPTDRAYVIYTSGSTGQPKGVEIHHAGLTNYAVWASKQYTNEDCKIFALYSSLAFDLTVTSIFVPLITGGTIRTYVNDVNGMVIRDVITDNAVDIIKLTPSHLALIRELNLEQSSIQKMIVGGEDFKTELAQEIYRLSNGEIVMYNEYGPTEGTVACMLHQYHPTRDIGRSVPIGTPADNMRVYILDDRLQLTPTGVIGEMYISGVGLAKSYLNRADLTVERFLDDPFDENRRMYKTGDIARWLPSGQLEFLGRKDQQVKVGGARIELGEIESTLLEHPAMQEVTVVVQQAEVDEQEFDLKYCVRCGLSSDFPGVTFNDEDMCSICASFEGYRDKAHQYFKDMDELETLFEKIKQTSSGEYDCIALVSGGKDSTYMLYSLVNLGLRVLSYTLDNGYISNEAKANIRRVTDALGVDHIFGETPFMNSIFVDSLNRYANVCNGCFKTLYTLAINLAREKGISTIVTGLSRGQFFETRLTEELFTAEDFNARAIDESIARVRKAYHQRDDIISRSLDVDVFRDEGLYQDIEFVDFYRYSDIDLTDLYTFLESEELWVRPSDTGRSTNCLINDLGIHVHKKRRGFHNYALPYSWDVRLGHKTREEAIDELNDEIDVNAVNRMMREIGYKGSVDSASGQEHLVAYYVASEQLSSTELRDFLTRKLPAYMIPTFFVGLDAMPLTRNGKVDKSALPHAHQDRDNVSTVYVAPSSELEETLVEIWQDILHIPQIGVNDNFFDLGGHSLPAIRILSRIEDVYTIKLPIDVFFDNPTVMQLAIAIEQILMDEIGALSDEEVLRLLAEDDDL